MGASLTNGVKNASLAFRIQTGKSLSSGCSEPDYDLRLNATQREAARRRVKKQNYQQGDRKRHGQFADTHQLMVGYHGHTETGPEHWEKAFSLAKYNGANVDIGHFVAGQNTSPIPFIKQYHERVTHVHIKDRKYHNGPNAPFGEGDTPIVEVLRLIRDNHWNIQATIEFEYKVPAGSTRNAELLRTIQFCRDALA